MKVAPLTGTFMITSIVGFLLFAVYVYDYHPGFGFAGALVFTLMFIAGLISMTHAPMEDYDFTRRMEKTRKHYKQKDKETKKALAKKRPSKKKVKKKKK